MSTYIRYAKATKLMINNVVYIISTSSFFRFSQTNRYI